MLEFVHGDRIEIVFEDSPAAAIRGTVARVMTDSEAGMGAEVQDYIACWAEISVDEPGDGPAQHFNAAAGNFQSLIPPSPMQETTFATSHKCAFWAALLAAQ